MTVVKTFGGDPHPHFLPSISSEDRAWATGIVNAIAAPRLVLNVGARWVTKRWPPARFAEVAALAVRERHAGLIAVGAPEDSSLVDELISRLGEIPILNLTGRTNLPRLAAVMEAADCVLSNDTGPLHLAAATGVPVVGVYTCTSPAKTGPYGTNARSVESRIWCAGSCVKRCDRMECMDELTADRVWAGVRDQIDWGRARRAS